MTYVQNTLHLVDSGRIHLRQSIEFDKVVKAHAKHLALRLPSEIYEICREGQHYLMLTADIGIRYNKINKNSVE